MLKNKYKHFMVKEKGVPLIGVTSDIKEINNKQAYFVYKAYTDAIEKSNGIPVLLTYTDYVKALANRLDGLVITGGDFDIPPAMYGEQPITSLKKMQERTTFESAMYIEALKKGIPVLGVCGGCQLINVIAGGSLYQDIKAQMQTNLDHTKGSHDVKIEPNTTLHGIIGQDRTTVNTSHHQAVKTLGKDIIVSAIADDGIIEAIEHRDFPHVLGIQWHPERMGQDMLPIYKWLVTAASERR
jgi:putative glutamine amidotransferase